MLRVHERDEQSPDRSGRPSVPAGDMRERSDDGAGPVAEGLIGLQRDAGNAAVGSLIARERATTVQRYPGQETLPAYGPGKGNEPTALPGKFDPAKTPGGQSVTAARVLVDGVRRELDRLALEEQRQAALSALMAREPGIYDTLHANPGKGLVVNLNFRVTDPSTLPSRAGGENKQKLELEFLNVSVSDPFEVPEPTNGPALTPSAAGAGDVGFGWSGQTLTATVRPVRPDPNKPKRFEFIDSVEGLLGYIAATNAPIPLVAGQLRSGRRSMLPTGTVVNQLVVEVNVGGTQLLVDEEVAAATADAMMNVGREQLTRDIIGKRGELEALQGKLSQAAGEGGFSRWRHDRPFQIDPHLLDSARAHLAAAEGYLGSDDLANGYESLTAFDDQLDLVRNQVYAYETNDFSDPARRDPTNVTDIL